MKEVPSIAEWRIILPKQYTKLASVHDCLNGIVVDSKKVLIGDLILSLLDQLDDHLLMDYLLRQGELKDLFESLLNDAKLNDSKHLAGLFKLVLDCAEDEPSIAIITSIFQAIGSSYNLAALDEKHLLNVFQEILKSSKGIEDKSILQQMYLELLGRIQLFDTPDAPLLSKVISGLLEHALVVEHTDQINEMYKALAKKTSPGVLVEAAIPHMSNYKLSTPILPKNCVFYQERGDGSIVAGIEVEKGMHDIVFGDMSQVVYNQVGYPKLLFWFSLNKGKVYAYVAAVKDTIIKNDTQLFLFPYSNVYASGQICWGSLNELTIKEVRQLESLPSLFLGATKNNDLYRNSSAINLRDLLITMQHQSFDDKTLDPMNKTVGSILNN
ncbi:hypothetical protein [Paenibacillus agricola]|uniref:Uncharacterized protein n=1 Tax=Paenibacillus agricola TaxID=2716264 RepID=A0ABX0JDD1_9BACL|nr:hypothetical protein [Paenibacillus agricola]NHN33259.1 hypothetical protein [Paenibacillus agricola]